MDNEIISIDLEDQGTRWAFTMDGSPMMTFEKAQFPSREIAQELCAGFMHVFNEGIRLGKHMNQNVIAGLRMTLASVSNAPLAEKLPNWEGSKTLDTELWKNPLCPMGERLEIADGAVAHRNEIIANLRRQLKERDAELEKKGTDLEDFQGAVRILLNLWGSGADVQAQINVLRELSEVTNYESAKG